MTGKAPQYEVLATFDKCPNPNCGSKKRLMDELVKQERTKGKIRGAVTPNITALSSFAANPATMLAALVGTKIPVGTAILDVCMDCGTLYATQLLKGEQVVGADGPPGVMGMQGMQNRSGPSRGNPS